MKAVIAEIDKRHMVVITEKGDFMRVKRQMQYTIGDELEVKRTSSSQLYRRISATAAMFLTVAFLYSGIYAYCAPYSYISVDINPSLTLSVNRFERVIGIEALNKEAETLLKDTSEIKNHSVTDAVAAILQRAGDSGYIKPDMQNGVMIVVSTDDKKEEAKLFEQVSSISEKELAKINKQNKTMVEKTEVAKYKEALSHRTSTGKFILAERIKEINPEIGLDEVKGLSVEQAVDLIAKGKNKQVQQTVIPQENNENEDNKQAETEHEKNKGGETKNKEKNANENEVKTSDTKGNGNGNDNGKNAVPSQTEVKPSQSDDQETNSNVQDEKQEDGNSQTDNNGENSGSDDDSGNNDNGNNDGGHQQGNKHN